MSSVSNPLYDAPKPSAPLLEEGADVQQLIAKAEDIARRIEPILPRLTQLHASWGSYQSNGFSAEIKKENSVQTYQELMKLEKIQHAVEREVLQLERQLLDLDNVNQKAALEKQLGELKNKLHIYTQRISFKDYVYKALPWGYNCIIS